MTDGVLNSDNMPIGLHGSRLRGRGSAIALFVKLSPRAAERMGEAISATNLGKTPVTRSIR